MGVIPVVGGNNVLSLQELFTRIYRMEYKKKGTTGRDWRGSWRKSIRPQEAVGRKAVIFIFLMVSKDYYAPWIISLPLIVLRELILGKGFLVIYDGQPFIP